MDGRYDYREAVYNDVMDYIREEIDLSKYDSLDDLEEYLIERLENEDGVTGGASGSYTFNEWKAEEYICHNLDLLADAAKSLDLDIDILEDGAEYCDAVIRSYVLPDAVGDAMFDIRDEFKAARAPKENSDDAFEL